MQLLSYNFKYIYFEDMMNIGIDEAGLGTLSGPLCAAVVVFGDRIPRGLKDSKKLSSLQRENLSLEIMNNALYYKIGCRHVSNIDEKGISSCWRSLIMELSSVCYSKFPGTIVLDGNQIISELLYVRPVVRADSKYVAVSAASILAKTEQCFWMVDYGKLYPEYDFISHHGYGTKKHMIELSKFGAIKGLHRKKYVDSISRNNNFEVRWKNDLHQL